MLAKKKAAKKSAIAAHSSALSSTVAAATSAKGNGKRGKTGAKAPASSSQSSAAEAESHRRPMTRADVQDVSTELEKVDLIRAIGDNINTRLSAMHQRGGANDSDDDIDDAVLHEERKYQLMEEARLAAGMQQRIVSAHIEDYCRTTTAAASDEASEKLALVRVKHNCNAITAVAALGLDVLVLGDKSGKVYMVDLNPFPDAPSLFASQRSEEKHEGKDAGAGRRTQPAAAAASPIDLSAYRRKKKMMLEPALPKAIVSLAISDTRGNRPTTRDLFEKTTVDHSCPSYTVAGSEDGSIAVWETFTQKHKGLLFMHRKAVTGLSFRTSTADLYSASDDGTLRVWSVPQMMSLDKLFGHEGKIHDLRALKKETCATVGDDGTMRFWKIDAATQQSFTYTVAQREEALAAAVAAGEITLLNDSGESAAAVTEALTATGSGNANNSNNKNASVAVQLECVAMVNEGTIVCGAADGSLVLFDTGKRRPLSIVVAAHGFDTLQDGTGLEKTALQLHRQQQAAEEEEEADAMSAADAAVRTLLGGAEEKSGVAAKSGNTGKKGKKAATVMVGATGTRPPRVFDRKRLPNAIAAVATVPYADVVASASYDGVVRLWQVRGIGGGSVSHGRRTTLGQHVDGGEAKQQPGLSLLAELPVDALVTSLSFAPDGDCLYIACSKECRRGRWVVCSAAQNGVAVVPLTAGGAKQFLLSAAGGPSAAVLSIEHVPAQLYSFQEAGEDGSEEETEEANEEAENTRGQTAAAPGDDLELEYMESDEESVSGNADDGPLPTKLGKQKRTSSGSASGSNAFFTVGKDGQLLFSSAGATASANDIMKKPQAAAVAAGSARVKKGAKKLPKSASVSSSSPDRKLKRTVITSETASSPASLSAIKLKKKEKKNAAGTKLAGNVKKGASLKKTKK